VIAGVDEIRPGFKRLRSEAAFRERGQQHAGHGGLSAAAVHAPDNQPG
jgi:hypothetical protein